MLSTQMQSMEKLLIIVVFILLIVQETCVTGETGGLRVVNRSQTSITVSWNAMESVSGYTIKYDKINNPKYIIVRSETTFEITGLEINTIYKIQVGGLKDVDGEERPESYSSILEARTLSNDLCDSSPCQNGGTCQDGGPPSSESSLPMYCQCTEKFSGRFCAVPKDSADCQTALGMENYGIPNERVQASSEWKFDKAIHGRLHFQSRSGNQGAWSAKTKDANQWLQIDLGSVFTKVTGVATQGRYMYDQWVTKYKVQFSNGGSTFTNYKEPGQAADKVFDGNTDQNTVVKHFLHAPFRARYIRFQPVTYYERISMRVELYGCSDFVCQSPDVILPNISPNASSNISIHRLRQFTIQSDVKFNCNIYYKASFLWRIYQLGKEETLLLSRNSFSELQITPRLLPVGEFLVRLNVSLIGTAVFGVGHGYFKVERSPLVAFIAGGNKVAKGLDRTLIFDASLSYDPDEKSLRFSGLNFTWQCKESPRHLNNSDEPGCHYRADDKETVGYELRINNSLMAENTSYFITVQVTKHERQAVYTQEVFIVPGDPPEVQIRYLKPKKPGAA